MIREIERKPIRYEEFWVLRAIDNENNKKVVVGEQKHPIPPTEQDIVDYLQNMKCSFVSVEHNFRLIKE